MARQTSGIDGSGLASSTSALPLSAIAGPSHASANAAVPKPMDASTAAPSQQFLGAPPRLKISASVAGLPSTGSFVATHVHTGSFVAAPSSAGVSFAEPVASVQVSPCLESAMPRAGTPRLRSSSPPVRRIFAHGAPASPSPQPVPSSVALPLMTRIPAQLPQRHVLVRTHSPVRVVRSPPPVQRSVYPRSPMQPTHQTQPPQPSQAPPVHGGAVDPNARVTPSLPWTLQLGAGGSSASNASSYSGPPVARPSEQRSQCAPGFSSPPRSGLRSDASRSGLRAESYALASPMVPTSLAHQSASVSAAAARAQAQAQAFKTAAAAVANVMRQPKLSGASLGTSGTGTSTPCVFGSLVAGVSGSVATGASFGSVGPGALPPLEAQGQRSDEQCAAGASTPRTPPIVPAPLSTSTSASSAPFLHGVAVGSTGGTGSQRGVRRGGHTSDRDSQAAFRTQVQDMLSQPSRITDDLKMHARKIFAEWQEGSDLPRDVAASVLAAAFGEQFPDLPVVRLDDSPDGVCEASELPAMVSATWLWLLKRHGLYTAEDKIGLDEMCRLFKHTLCQVRDCFASREFLRAMQTVTRGKPRLKDRYDSFEFQAKDCLGKMYRCRDTVTKEPRSCQQIRKDKASVPVDVIRERLVAMCDLNHPNVPTIHEHLEDFHNFYIISAPHDGAELLDCVQDSYVRSGSITEAWVASVLRQILEALVYCHSHPRGPVLHRDLRPACVMLQVSASSENGPYGRSAAAADGGASSGMQEPRVLVGGFGLQELFGMHGGGAGMLPLGALPHPPARNGAVQTPALCFCMPEALAPEVWRLDAGPKCDVWACGCLMFLMLAGQLPFGSMGMPPKEIVREVGTHEPDWRLFRHVSTAALALCRRMLVKDDSARPSVAECLRHPWFSVGLGTAERIPRELRPDTLGSLVQFYAQSKFQQVLMNVVASELQADQLQRMRSVFHNLDPEATGRVTPDQFRSTFSELGISPNHTEQVLNALGDGKLGSNVAYAPFVAGCMELVDDKLDHMLWKVFAMVDEDHSGEIGAVVLEHFLQSACDNKDAGSDCQNGQTDVERYLYTVLGSGTSPNSLVKQICNGRDVVTFEEIKGFITKPA